ncbi:hypothetical protein F0562_017171 [Nyssa sinensis]|uniref:Uncharacterized protein n=1 Tax=Nyssa sinensis TaxID=561372 RepID=A0A5J4ZIH8_9ASTE|nr:hypothetical protein F0562_017171 [Nyssa sinensis]
MSAVPCHTVNFSETVIVSSQSSEDKISISDSNDAYGLTSEYEAFIFVPLVGENLKKSTFNIVVSSSMNVEVHGRDDLSDFEFNDDAEYNPSSDDNSNDEGGGEGEGEGEGKGKSTSRGLDRVIAETFSKATYRRCCRHLCANIRSKFPRIDVLKKILLEGS